MEICSNFLSSKYHPPKLELLPLSPCWFARVAKAQQVMKMMMSMIRWAVIKGFSWLGEIGDEILVSYIPGIPPRSLTFSPLQNGGWKTILSFWDSSGKWRFRLNIPYQICNKPSFARWWFQTFFIFTPIWGRFPSWLIFFRWVETTNQLYSGIISYEIRIREPEPIRISWFMSYTHSANGQHLNFSWSEMAEHIRVLNVAQV